ncbi:stromelysin-3-like isoform X1 [Cimex lectularius]|uniref:Peptidase metallopeptidase domain-containing protein n=1 Tax=Cimex lectularius TaxID=79782 RepID=A0A8I6RYD3_CIMLE|nr:stromelysin-3-like isoform X1 [Cimex lectularius]
MCNSNKSETTMLFLLLRICLLALLVRPTFQNDAISYLSLYGYLPRGVNSPNSESIIDEDTYVQAVMKFQSFAGLEITGKLDNETLETMKLPRCGVGDNLDRINGKRTKRYVLQGSRWRIKDLTYKISKYPSALSKTLVDIEVKKAFRVWSEVTPLSFTRKTSGPVNIEVRFEKGEHGDGDPFDGQGGTLAHAFFPVFGGDAHFDDSERWTVNTYKGTNLFQVAVHEFGHSLGLSHSEVRASLMAPFYRGYQPDFELHRDDIEAIQALYGRPTSHKDGKDSSESNPATTEDPRPIDRANETTVDNAPDICDVDSIDTMFNSAEGITYVFKGSLYWRLTKTAIAAGYPRYIGMSWKGLPGNIDAAFTYKNGKTYFFKGSQYWRFTGKSMDKDYPKLISNGFEGIPNNLDAAMVWGGNGKIYFYKGYKFWRYDPTQKPAVKNTYPKAISNWEGVPDNIEAALQYTNGYTYFFKNKQYYRFNDNTFSVDSTNPPFPRPSGPWWFGCDESNARYTGEKPTEEQDSRRLWSLNKEGTNDALDGALPPAKRAEGRTDSEEKGMSWASRSVATMFIVLCSVLVSL